MSYYLKLVHFELTRFRWLYISLFFLILLSQVGGLYIYAQTLMKDINTMMIRETLTEAEYVMRYGVVGFDRFLNDSIWFMAPIALCITALILYVFIIWYRDWLGKNMFIYRLLMLPTARSKVYLAKASVILFTVWGLIGFQLILLPLLERLYNSIVPSVYRYSMPVIDMISQHPIMKYLAPRSMIEFGIYYSAGLMIIFALFTGILLERSFRWKGMLAGIVYAALACALLALPLIISSNSNYFYPIEIVLMAFAVEIIISSISLWLSFFLLNKKISV